MRTRTDSAEWILRTTRKILRDQGPKAAKRFLESRGGTAKWQAAAREVARHALQRVSSGSRKNQTFIGLLNGSVVLRDLSEEVL